MVGMGLGRLARRPLARARRRADRRADAGRQGIAHAFGFTCAKVPLEVLVVAQISVGVLLGCQFRGLTLKEFTEHDGLGACLRRGAAGDDRVRRRIT